MRESIVKTLEILEKQSINPILAKSTKKINEDIKKGLTLGNAFRNNSDVFPEMFINMVEAGEISGSLNTTLNRLAVHYEKENTLINKVKSAITYPIILSITAVAVVIFHPNRSSNIFKFLKAMVQCCQYLQGCFLT